MSEALEPVEILVHAAERLRADNHVAYAEAVTEVATYLRELEVNHLEMTHAVDELLANAPDALTGES